MKLELRTRTEPDVELIGLSVAAVVFSALAIWLVLLGGDLPRNGLHEMLDFTCALCGGTRSLVFVFSGDLPAAFAMNPMVTVGTLGLLVWCLYAASVIALSLPRVRLVLESLFELRMVTAGVLLVLIANWIYVWLMGI